MELIKQSKVTLSLISINVVMFMVSYFAAGTLDDPYFTLKLLHNGALFNPLALGGEPWRLLTSVFLHGGIMHLLFNQYALYSVGTGWEKFIGWRKWLSVYLVCGLAASLSSLWWNLFTIGVGASGAIFGLFGFVLVESWRVNRSQQISNRPMLINFAVFLGINILLAELLHADNSAHFGGLICGVCLSGLRKVFHPFSLKSELLMAAILVLIFFLLPRTQTQYYNAFQKVLAIEDSVRFLYDRNLPDKVLVEGLRKTNSQWDSVSHQIAVITPIIGDLPNDTMAIQSYIRNTKLQNEFRIEMIKRESYVYLDSIETLQQQADSLPKIKYNLNFRIGDVDNVKHPERKPSFLKAVTIFYDSNWVETPFRPFKFYRVGQRDSLNRWQGQVRDFYQNDQVQMKGNYLDDLHHGIFIYYSRNKTYEAAGRFDHDLRVGKWELYHTNGKLEREIFYGDKDYVRNVWDSLGNQLVVNGNGFYESKRWNGSIKESGFYRNGLKNGLWKGFHPDGKPYFEEEFFDGRMIRGRSISKTGLTFRYDETSMLALPSGGMKSFQEYVKKAARLFNPQEAGIVKIYFRVTVNNRITDIIVQKSLSLETDAWAKDILLKGPVWNPARIHGQEFTDGFGFVTVEFGHE